MRGDPGLLQGSDGGPSRNDLAQRVKFVQAGNSARLLGRDELFPLQGFYIHLSEPGVRKDHLHTVLVLLAAEAHCCVLGQELADQVFEQV